MWQEQLVFSLVGGNTLTVTNANIWQGSLTIEQSVSASDEFEIGSTHIGQMTVTLADMEDSRIENAVFSINNEGHLMLNGETVTYQTVYANVDFMGATVVVYMAQDSDTLQQIGVYTVVSAVYDSGLINITAYDNMNNLSEPYTTSLTFPSTYGAMANEITGQILTFDGSTTAVAEKPEAEDLTKREVLGYIAQACGYNVICNPQGYFQFVRYNLSGFATQGQYHEISGLYSFHHSQYPVVITGVKVIVTDEEMTTDPDTGDTVAEIVTHEYTAGTDAYQLVIEENPLITTANGQAVADALYALYGNVEFYTGDVSHLSDLSIKASDIMKVTDRHNNTYPMLVSRTVISTGSAQNTSSYAEEPSRKIVTQPSQMSRIQNSVKQAEVEAKNSKRIASNTNQYFWHTETGTDTGAHITEIPQDEFLADPENGGGNLLARSNGVAIRDGLVEVAQFDSDGVTFNDSNGNATAEFGTNGFFIGQSASAKISYDTTNGLSLGSNVSILPSGVFRVDYYDYEFAVNPVNQYVFMRAYDNKMQVSQSGVDILTDGNGINIEATDSGVDLSSISSTAIDSSLSAHVGVDQSSTGSMASMSAHTVAINAENGTAHPTGAIILMTGNVRIGNSNRADNLDVYGNVTAHSVQSYTPTWETGHEPAASHCVVSAGICSIFYQGPATTHAANTLLGTLPVGARPVSNVFCPFVKAGVAYGTIRIETTGEIYVGFISSTTASNRIYFNCSYPVV